MCVGGWGGVCGGGGGGRGCVGRGGGVIVGSLNGGPPKSAINLRKWECPLSLCLTFPSRF